MSERIRQMRDELYQRLKANGIQWNHILKQKGMFSYTGLTGEREMLGWLCSSSGFGILLRSLSLSCR